MGVIKQIIASENINSRGYPTIAGKLVLENGMEVSTTLASLEKLFDYQATEIRDNDKERFNGKGVLRALHYINDLIGPKLKGINTEKQVEIDNWLVKSDGSKDKSGLGVNTLLTVSILIAKASAKEQKVPFYKYINNLFNKYYQPSVEIEKIPTPIFPLLIGGKHGQADLEFKEFQVIPSSSFSYTKSYQVGVDLYHLLRELYKFKFAYNTDVIEAIKDTVTKKGLNFGRDIFLGMNFGASFYHAGNKYILKDKQQPILKDEYSAFIEKSIIQKYYPLVVTDCFINEDWQAWQKFNNEISKETYVVADELIGSNKERLEKAVKEKVCSAIVLRLNQIGTITETFSLIEYARKNQLSYQIASDLAETNDSFTADFSVGVGAEYVNFGPPVHGENVAKYNRLLEIEREINIKNQTVKG